MLESYCHGDNAFVTLTYNDENVPLSENGLLNLDPVHLRNWLKRLRKRMSNEGDFKLRFYGVGEYGSKTWRPHYHVLLFGYPPCTCGNRFISPEQTNTERRRRCFSCRVLADTWTSGNIYNGDLTPQSARYCSGYVVKRMTKHGDERLDGRHPEFARMSNRPGIGADMMSNVAQSLVKFDLAKDGPEDVPLALRHGASELPLGRYLRRRLRKILYDREEAGEVFDQKTYWSMYQLLKEARDNQTSAKKVHIAKTKQARLNQETRHNLYKQRKEL